MANLKDINLNPYYQVSDLPSKYVPYPGGKVYYRLLSTREALELSSMTKESDIFRFVLGGIKTEGFEKEDILFPDFIFVSLLRGASSGSVDSLIVEKVCDFCGERMREEVSISSVYMDDIDDPDQLQRKIPIEGTEWAVVLSFPTIRRYLDYLDIKEREPERDEMASVAVFLTGIHNTDTGDTIGLDVNEAMEVMENLPVGIFEEAFKYVDKMVPKVRVTCSNCGRENIVQVRESTEVLIKPFRRGRANT